MIAISWGFDYEMMENDVFLIGWLVLGFGLSGGSGF